MLTKTMVLLTLRQANCSLKQFFPENRSAHSQKFPQLPQHFSPFHFDQTSSLINKTINNVTDFLHSLAPVSGRNCSRFHLLTCRTGEGERTRPRGI